jgi:hypothetical protein
MISEVFEVPMVKKGSSKKMSVSRKTASAQVKHSAQVASHPFITLDGKQLQSIVQLARELDSMTDEVFYHHVTESRHDFATWIKDCFALEQLSQELTTARTKDKNGLVVYRYLYSLK